MQFSPTVMSAKFITAVLTSIVLSGTAAKAGAYYANATAAAEVDGGTQPWTGYVTAGTYPYYPTTSASVHVENVGGTFNGASATSWASADLSTGQLKTYAAVTQDDYTTWAGRTGANGRAVFGDSFTTTSPTGPFVWGDGDVGTFTINLDGVLGANFTNPADVNYGVAASAHLIWSIGLDIYQSGTFDSGFMTGGVVGNCSWSGFLDGSTSTSCTTSDITTSISGDLASGYEISAILGIGSDFDWELSLQSVAYLMAPGELTVDLGHTLSLSYDGPAGATTQSASGVFPFATDPGTPGVTVSAPASMGLLGLGLLSLVAVSRRRHII